jgi:hypothetical protein
VEGWCEERNPSTGLNRGEVRAVFGSVTFHPHAASERPK